MEYSDFGKTERLKETALLDGKTIKTLDEPAQEMLLEDLTMLDDISDSSVLNELKQRFENKKFQTFVGDILISINPYENNDDIYGEEVS